MVSSKRKVEMIMAGAGGPGKLEDILNQMLEKVEQEKNKASEEADDTNRKYRTWIDNGRNYLAN